MSPVGTRRVLIIDDDPQMAEVMAALLRMACDEIAIVGTLRDGLRLIQTKAFAVVLLDLMLPDSRADRTLAAIPEFRAAGVPRVVCVTGSDFGDEVRATAAENGAEAVWQKNAELARHLAGLFSAPPRTP